MNHIGTALVTGGARRLGRATVTELARAGYRVAFQYRFSEAEARSLLEEIRTAGGDARAYRFDLLEAGAPSRLLERVSEDLGAPSLLVHNASLFYPTPLEKVDSGDWRRFLGIHLFAPFELTRAAVEPMRAQGGGSVVGLVDIHARFSLRDHVPYVVSKAALEALIRTLAAELAPEIRVNGIAPGAMLLPEGHPPDARERMIASIPLGRLGGAEAIAQAVLYLARADYITGEILTIDGGRSVTLG